jgi:hypothetical protein
MDLGGYDGVLGIDWLSLFSPMQCEWKQKWIEIVREGETVKLQGVLPASTDNIKEVSIEQVYKWHKGK